ncbi:hypothetical protein LINPERPRIM_LOCUS31294, partial [Linum perenne]
GLAARNPRRGSGRAIFDGKKRRSKRERWRRWIIVGEERDGSGFMHAVRGGSGSRHRRRAVAEVAGITRRQVESESEKKKGDRHPFRKFSDPSCNFRELIDCLVISASPWFFWEFNNRVRLAVGLGASIGDSKIWP